MRLFGRANIDSEWAEATRCAWVGLGGCMFMLTLDQALPSRWHLLKYGWAWFVGPRLTGAFTPRDAADCLRPRGRNGEPTRRSALLLFAGQVGHCHRLAGDPCHVDCPVVFDRRICIRFGFICFIARGGLDSFCRQDGRCRQVGRT
uniref:Uncharacterized protein n=1 Tax=Plectus sambesii TaxID=2011161 RepID=A0A914WUA4_9BILA